MSSTLDASTLELALRDLTARCLGGANASLSAFNALTEAHLAALDQATVLVDAAREDMQHTTDVAFAGLLAQTRVRGWWAFFNVCWGLFLSPPLPFAPLPPQLTRTHAPTLTPTPKRARRRCPPCLR